VRPSATAVSCVLCREKSGCPVRADQLGDREQQEDRPAAARVLDLERRRPDDRGDIGHVDVATRREVLEVEARQQQQHGDDADGRREGRARQAVGAGRDEHERDDRSEHDEPQRRVGVEGAEHDAEGDAERVLGRAVEDGERRQVPLQDLATPDEVVLRVVDRVGRDRQERDERRDRERGEGDPLPCRDR
jgi:hypothetical protein